MLTDLAVGFTSNQAVFRETIIVPGGTAVPSNAATMPAELPVTGG